ncbi:Pentatricopeptide repeat (PPR) superfamily protein [Trifolium repens]|nr:Pentatricopeptide repeat (PPR) superfamily protein [Trifolium repens]
MVSSQNPEKEAKLLLQNNRRSTWKLASQQDEMGMEEISSLDEDNEEMGSQKKEPSFPEGVVGEIVQIARNLSQNLTLEEALGECHEPSLVTPRAFTVLFPLLGKARMGDKLLVLFRNLPSSKEFRNVRVYNAAISGLLSDGRYEDAWKVYESMETDNVLPDHMKKVGIKPTSHSYTAMIHAYSVSGWHEKAYVAFENMIKEGIEPSIETYTTLLDASRRTGDTETLMKIWKLMMKQKVKGTQVTFNILVDGFAKQGLFMEARDVVSEFGKIGLQPTVVTYNMLMNAYARGGFDSKLPQLLKEMEALKLKPDSVTYSTMIYAFVRVRDYKRAFFYHKQMVKSGQVMDITSYRKLRDILDVKAADKNRSDKVALLGMVNKKMGHVKKKGKKDEFWKYKTGRPIRT